MKELYNFNLDINDINLIIDSLARTESLSKTLKENIINTAKYQIQSREEALITQKEEEREETLKYKLDEIFKEVEKGEK